MTDSYESYTIVTDSHESVKGIGGERLKINRKKLEICMARAQLNRDTLAQKAEMPCTSFYNVYSRCSCRPATAGRIAVALGVDVTEILED